MVQKSANVSRLGLAPRSATADEVRQLIRIRKDEVLTALMAENRRRELVADRVLFSALEAPPSEVPTLGTSVSWWPTKTVPQSLDSGPSQICG